MIKRWTIRVWSDRVDWVWTQMQHKGSADKGCWKSPLTVLLSRKHTEFVQLRLVFQKRIKRQKDIGVFLMGKAGDHLIVVHSWNTSWNQRCIIFNYVQNHLQTWSCQTRRCKITRTASFYPLFQPIHVVFWRITQVPQNYTHSISITVCSAYDYHYPHVACVRLSLTPPPSVSQARWRSLAGAPWPPGSAPCSTALEATSWQTSCWEAAPSTISSTTATSCWPQPYGEKIRPGMLVILGRKCLKATPQTWTLHQLL